MNANEEGHSSNRLIDALPEDERKALLEHSTVVELELGESLFERGMHVSHVYFPTDGFLSLVETFDGRRTLEVGLIGNEGAVGITVLLGVMKAPLRAVVQGAGHAIQIRSELFIRHVDAYPVLWDTLRKYLYVLMLQSPRAAACAYFHDIEARLARWLLMTQDRSFSDQFFLTHKFLASMLGVRRSGVTIAAGVLQARQLITYHRGSIKVIDRDGLEQAACTCYRVLLEDYAGQMEG